jgi:hypothetical protein
MSKTTTTLFFLAIAAGPNAAAADPSPDSAAIEGHTSTVDLKVTADVKPEEAATADDKKKLEDKIVALEQKVAALEPKSEDQHVDAVASPRPLDRGTPRFEISGGLFVQSRGIDFLFDPNAGGAPPSYPASNLQGFQVAAALYPMPVEKGTGRLSGVGVTFKLAKSVGATLGAGDDNVVGDFPINFTAYEVGVHYRYPIDNFAIDGSVSYGSWGHSITGLPDDVEIPDTSYQYVAAGLHADFYPSGGGTSFGLGAKYLSLLSTGDVGSSDWYGSGSAGGVVLDANFTLPLPGHLFVRGILEYTKFWIDFDGTGDLSDAYGVSSMNDTSVTGSAQIGLQF